MRKWCMKSICALAMIIALAGCHKILKQKETSLAIDPVAKRLAVPPQFASMAIDKTGGLEAWGRVRVILLDGVVTYYDKDAGYYLTEQNYDLYPWSNSIVISGKEGDTVYTWQFSQGKFRVVSGASQIESFGNQIDNSCFLESILDLVTAPARFLDRSAEYSRRTDAVNIHGQWCYPITRTVKAKGEKSAPLSNITYYQNRDTSLVDMMLITGKNNTSFLVTGYDYEPIRDGEISVPSRIEIYTTSSEGIPQRQIFRIDISAASQK
jgi:hypothetical protein